MKKYLILFAFKLSLLQASCFSDTWALVRHLNNKTLPGNPYRSPLLSEHVLNYDLSKYISGEIVVDLGAGTTANGYNIAIKNKAKKYIPVEMYPDNAAVLRQAIPGITIHNTDMLSFLKTLPRRSVVVLAIAIDGFILENPTYIRQVEVEIKRVAKVYLGFNSVFNIGETPVKSPEFMKTKIFLKEQNNG